MELQCHQGLHENKQAQERYLPWWADPLTGEKRKKMEGKKMRPDPAKLFLSSAEYSLICFPGDICLGVLLGVWRLG
jgi:hypothetical protein